MSLARVSLLLCALTLAACARTPAPAEENDAASRSGNGAGPQTAAADAETPRTAGAVDFPVIPQIVVPEIVGVGPAQRALEASMGEIIDPIDGITVRPAHCGADGVLFNDAGITSVDAQGNLARNGDEGIFSINADGSGTANFEGGIIAVEADGSGTINGSGKDGADDAIIAVEADGSGTYNGKFGIISLDGKGAGTWNGEHGTLSNNGDGSGTWNGPEGIVTINNDGSGTWNGAHGLVVNNGDGTGRVGTPGRAVKMAPIPKVVPAGKFPPLKKFAPPGAPCGFVISLEDRVLFDFDKSDIRPDAAKVLDTLAAALEKVPAKAMEIRGHTDAKGTEDYNQDLSERRAQSVAAALRQRGAAQDASAKGYGESQPVAPNDLQGQDNPAGRQLNRRVEIFVRT
ncbi:OmpA family protein [Luteimonas aquatica]|uniref:OmpA family protein n=1 Tax=Luteimonas aquatica TaxID=450364 RepID=UPI001F5A5634|nr:OmpA family protein [Luteimonas aquatica]